MKRLFFALWPNNVIRRQIDMITQSINLEGLKKVANNNLHVTLVFIGSVEAETEWMIRERMKNIRVHDFSIRFDQLAYWGKPRVLCLTPLQFDQQLQMLVDAISREIECCAVICEKRPYRPHITLARKAVKLIDVDVQPIDWQAQSFSLVESLSTLGGVEYKVLQSWNFR